MMATSNVLGFSPGHFLHTWTLMPYLLACLLLWAVCPAQSAPTSEEAASDEFTKQEIRKMEQFAGEMMACANIPGMSLGVVRGDATFATGLGVADMMTGHPVDKRTIFSLGSTAKAFVPYVLAEIMNGKENSDGRMKWSSTLNELLAGDFDLELSASPWGKLTLKDMLIYECGSSAADLGTMSGLPGSLSREELVRRILTFLPHDDMELRGTHHYSNLMYTLAAHVAERVSGLSWKDLVKARVLDKQDMNASSFAPDGMTGDDAALPYRFHVEKIEEPFVAQHTELFNIHPFEPVGSLMASSEDVTKWLRHLLHNLKVKGHDSGINLLIGDSFHQWVTAPTNASDGFMRHHSELAMGYGMGWFSSIYRGFRRFRHAGSLYAYQSQIWLFPESQSAVYISTSGPGTVQSQRAVDAILYNVADVILGLHPWIGIDEACAKEENDFTSDETLPYNYDDGYYYNDEGDDDMAPMEQRMINYLDNLNTYEGTYGNGYLGNVIIERNEGGVLGLKLGHNVQGELHPEDEKHRMKFHVKGPLENTVEWSEPKDVEFLLSSLKTEGTSERYYTIRLELQDAHYDFHRGNLFEEMLDKKLELLVKEQQRKAEMEAKAKMESEQKKQEEAKEKVGVTEIMEAETAANVVKTEMEKDVNTGGEKESAEEETLSHGAPETNAITKTNDKSKDTEESRKDKKEEDSEQHPLNDDNTVESVEGETPLNMKEDSSESGKTREHYVIEEKEKENNLQKEEKPRLGHVKTIDQDDVEEGRDSESGPKDSGLSVHSPGWMRYCWSLLIVLCIKYTIVILEL